MASQSASRFGWSPAQELALYLIHGLLHLCGYDDGTEPERRLMRRRERAILKLLGD
jgi:probable rRNA maturation factor